MNQYLFELGHQPHISTAEIQAVFSHLSIKYKIIRETIDYLILDVGENLNVIDLMNILGGTIKIAEKIPSKDNVESIAKHLYNLQSEGKIQFSLSGPDARNKALQIKKDLKSEDKSVRYIEPKNTATILHNNLIERETDFLMEDGSVFVTRAIQPFEEFTERDFSRPRPDKLSGMLPPKLARILINLSEAKIDDQILDPFCGSGTILAEAAHMGYKKLIGSDLSSKAIKDTENNLEWLKNSSKISKLNYKLYFSDVNTLADKIDKKTINTIITEPYMGRPLKGTERKIDLVSQTRELKDLYLGAFKTFDKVLKKNSTIIFIIPRFKFQDSWVTIDCKDDIKKLGFKIEPFSPENDFLLYHRPQQHVGREIWKFRQA